MLFCFRVEICNEMRVCFCLLYNNIFKGMWPQYWNASDAHVANHNPCMSAAHNVSFTIHNNSIYQTRSHDEWSVLHVYNRTNVLVILIAFATTKAVRQNFIWKTKYKTTDTNMKISLNTICEENGEILSLQEILQLRSWLFIVTLNQCGDLRNVEK